MPVTNQPVARLTWQSDAGVQEYLLKPGDVVSLGRGESNSIVINSPKVSRNHARVEWSDDRFVVRDLNSSNGTFVNGQRVETMPWSLEDGDEVTLERFLMTFTVVPIAKVVQDRFSMRTIAGMGKADVQRPRLVITEGPDAGQEFPITGESLSIGRASQNASWDVRLNDRTVSRPHARIEKKSGAYVLVDLGSANGTTLNELFVIEPVILNEGDVIGLGATKLAFYIR
jgi:pSer/pThr/pTyr-binding forkhead associated (FHA) protein